MSYGDTILPGAFKRTIHNWMNSKQQLPVLWQHFFHEPIGGIHHLEETKRGLFVRGNLLVEHIPRAEEARQLLLAKILRGMSIGFTIPKGQSSFKDDYTEREIREVTLWETSIVTFPANQGALVSHVKGLCPGCEHKLSADVTSDSERAALVKGLHRAKNKIDADQLVASLKDLLTATED